MSASRHGAGAGSTWSARETGPQLLIALIAIVALEAVFAAMARLGDLSVHIPEFMALALGAGVLYFVALYALDHTRDDRAVLWLVLFGVLAFQVARRTNELGVRIARFVSELLGSYAILGEPTEFVPDAPRWQNRLLSSRQYTIAGGTSEIQRNILGERQLGLPKG